jgi:hypothetical protein
MKQKQNRTGKDEDIQTITIHKNVDRQTEEARTKQAIKR